MCFYIYRFRKLEKNNIYRERQTMSNSEKEKEGIGEPDMNS